MTFLEKLTAEFPHTEILNQEPLAKHTSFRIGGPAVVVFPKTCDDLVQIYRFCLDQKQAVRILGSGTNILAPDEGVSDLVICTKGLTKMQNLGEGKLEAECGASLARFACIARDLSLTGLEFAHGIPGTVGGGVFMNAGAYGGEMRHVVVKTLAMRADGSLFEVEGQAHEFSYRHSIFEESGAVILKTQVQLSFGDKEQIAAKMQELAQKRRASQPLDMPSAGSTFKRPVGGYAAAMIDETGLKGKGIGGAAVSEKHAGFVVNTGGATAADVLATMMYIKEKVYERFGVELEPEVRIW